MENTLYRSKIGDVKTYKEWKIDAERYYSSLPFVNLGGRFKFSFDNSLPADWFERYTRILKLEEVTEEEYRGVF